MTNVRVTLVGADEWRFCPYCGRKVELHQSPDAESDSEALEWP